MIRTCIASLAAIALAAAEPAATATRAIPAIGTLRARQAAVLGSQVSGRVAAVLVDVGSPVAAGQELLRLDDESFRLAVAMREAELASARAREATATSALATAAADIAAAEAEAADAARNRERMTALWEKPAGAEPSIPQKLFDEAVTRDRTAQARLAAARARQAEAQARKAEASAGIGQVEAGLARARHDLAECTVRAPFAGVVARRLVDPGAPVTSAPVSDLIEVQETSRLWLECSVPQDLLGAVAPGGQLRWNLEGRSERQTARIETVFPALDPATRSLRLRAAVDNAAGRLRPGSLVAIDVEVAAP